MTEDARFEDGAQQPLGCNVEIGADVVHCARIDPYEQAPGASDRDRAEPAAEPAQPRRVTEVNCLGTTGAW